MEESKDPKVAWASDRQREVGTAAGYRLREGKVEVLERRGDDFFVKSVRPGTLAEERFWSMLMVGESKWISFES